MRNSRVVAVVGVAAVLVRRGRVLKKPQALESEEKN